MSDLDRITIVIETLPDSRAQVSINIPGPTPGMKLETAAHALAIDTLTWLGKQPAVAGFVYSPDLPNERAAHIVLDLETLSTSPAAAVASIGAVALSAQGEFISEFHIAIDTAEQEHEYVRDVDPKTVEWWDKQSEEAKAASIAAANPIPAQKALTEFSGWVMSIANPKKVKVWGNGSSFDNVILSSLYEDCTKIERPWAYWNDRDMRTVLDLQPHAKDVGNFVGIKHHALHDARHEAKQLAKVLAITAQEVQAA